MLIGDLDLDWAENDANYLARTKDLLVSNFPTPSAETSHDDDASNFGIRCSSIIRDTQLGIEVLPEKVNEFGGDTT